MNWSRLPFAVMAAFALLLTQAWAVPARAQSLLRDAETEKLFRDIGEPLMQAAGLDPRAVAINLVGSNEINAFATLGQSVYFYLSLIHI